MPDVSKYEAVLQGLEDGTYRTLGLSIGSYKISPGEKIDKRDTQPTPTLSAPPGLPRGAYTIISVDLDGPFVSWNVCSPTAHWIQTGFKVEQPSHELKSDEPAIAPWAAAGPPPGAAPHRYVFLLYNQTPLSPTSPYLKKKPITIFQRIRFDVDAMATKLGLGEIVAATYFVSN